MVRLCAKNETENHVVTGEERKKRKTVIKTIIRRKRRNTTSEGPQGGNGGDDAVAYVLPAVEVDDGDNGGEIPTPPDSMDKYAQASCQLDAARLESQPAEEMLADTLQSTLVDPEPVLDSQVIAVDESQEGGQKNLERDLEEFMDAGFDDRQRLPEEETQKPEHDDEDVKQPDDVECSPHTPDKSPEDENSDPPTRLVSMHRSLRSPGMMTVTLGRMAAGLVGGTTRGILTTMAAMLATATMTTTATMVQTTTMGGLMENGKIGGQTTMLLRAIFIVHHLWKAG